MSLIGMFQGCTTEGSLSPKMVRSLKESSGLIRDYPYYRLLGPKVVKRTLKQMEEEPGNWVEASKIRWRKESGGLEDDFFREIFESSHRGFE